MTTLVYISPVPWSGLPHRSQEMIQWLHNQSACEVIWVNPYPTRLPRRGDLDKWRAEKIKLTEFAPDWLEVVNLRYIPIEPLKLLRQINKILWLGEMLKLRSVLQRSGAQLLVGKPSLWALFLASNVGRRFFFDAMDDYGAFYKKLEAKSMDSIEIDILNLNPAVTVSSTGLKLKFDEYAIDNELVLNGFNPSHIAKTWSLSKHEKLRLGFVGTIGSWFDWAMICELAESNPDAEFLMIGPIYEKCPIELPKNIQLLGPRNHLDAMEFIKSFDYGLIPFKINRLTDCVDAIKFYEYLASGVPVLCSNFGEMRYRVGKSRPVTKHDRCKDQSDLRISADWICFEPGNEEELRDLEWQARFSKSKVLKKLQLALNAS